MQQRTQRAKARATGTGSGSRAPRAPDAGGAPDLRLAEVLDQQAATSAILRVISTSRSDAQPVFDAIAAAAYRLLKVHAANVFTFDGALVHVAATANPNPEYAAILRRAYPRPPGGDSGATRAVLTRDVVTITDVLDDRDYAIKETAAPGGLRSVLAVPLMHDGNPIGAIAVGRPDAGTFRPSEIELLRTFADQTVIAIENVRLFNELDARNLDLAEALERQTATSEILRAISTSRSEVQPVFEVIAAAARRLCGATAANVVTFDGALVHVAALAGTESADGDALRRHFANYPRPPSRETANTRAVLTRAVVMIPDVLEDPDYRSGATAIAAGYRSVLSVPLMRGEKPLGAITVARPAAGPFPDAQVALLETFAEQAVITMENVRLFTEVEARNRDLTESLEQQTATSDILRVISRSQTDVQPVFDTIAAAAFRLCDAHFANVFTFDGELLHVAASKSVDPGYAEALRRLFPRPPSRDTGSCRAVLTKRVVTIPDIFDDPDYVPRNIAVTGDYRSVIAVPLLRDGQPIGSIAVGRPEPRMFPDTLVELLKTFADQAVIAIENVRLFTELDASTKRLTRSVEELRVLGEVGRAVSSTLDLETVLRTIVARACELTGMIGGAIYEYDEMAEIFHLRATERYSGELIDSLQSMPIRKGEGAIGRLAMTGEPVQIHDIFDERAYQSSVRDILIRSGYRSLLTVPLLYEGRLLGGLSVNRSAPGAFSPQVVELLTTFATQSALAIQNARLYREIEQKGRELEAASRHKSEFLANMSHELRTPLNAILGFSEVLQERLFGEINDKQEEYLRDILESGRHLLTLINDILDLSKIEAGRMELDLSEFGLPQTIDTALTLVRERATRRNIMLGRSLGEGVGTIRADERKVKQVLLNLLSNALKFTPEGGRVEVSARVVDGAAEVAVSDSGVGIAAEDQATVFEEFRQVGASSKKVEGTGLGLAISRKFIELHGGRIGVASQPGQGATFTFTLPLRGRG